MDESRGMRKPDCSGASLHELERIRTGHPDLPILQKPFKVSDLLTLIEMSQSASREEQR